jgi:hypothetical protein
MKKGREAVESTFASHFPTPPVLRDIGKARRLAQTMQPANT